MPRYLFKTCREEEEQQIDADSYHLDMKGNKLTFYNRNNDQIASFHADSGAYVKQAQ
jgi:hypothetical protein